MPAHALIELGDRDGLAERGALIFRGLRVASVKKVVLDTQRLFWDNRTGEPTLNDDA